MSYEELLYDLFQAYYDCRKNKRNTTNQLQFELDYESNLIKLADEIYNRTYQVGKSIAFVVDKPVKREIFAWDFRDRIVHHLLYNYLYDLFDRNFIYDSYSCRIGKWTLFGIKRVEKFMRKCSENYKKDCYILRLDIQWFFMSIDKDILFTKLLYFIAEKYHWRHKQLILDLIEKVVYNDPTKNCIIKWDYNDWQWIPKHKTLFHQPQNKWIAIGNLTSQLFANFYLNEFDHFIKKQLKCKYYGRYVDDFVIYHQNKDYLLSLIPKIDAFLNDALKLKLHPNKRYIQHYSKWVYFLWAYIKPYRNYISKRTKWNIYQKITYLNHQIRKNKGKADKLLQQEFQQSINSYLWFLKHYKSYKLRKKILSNWISIYWRNYFYPTNGIEKGCFFQKSNISKI